MLKDFTVWMRTVEDGQLYDRYATIKHTSLKGAKEQAKSLYHDPENKVWVRDVYDTEKRAQLIKRINDFKKKDQKAK